jgi:two-component system, response regulator PdtaR
MDATRILIAEDETIIRLDLVRLLAAAGFDVCAEARDGLEAVELAASTTPDVAILDVKMPQLDGLEAARRMLAARPLPVLLLTAFGDAELIARAADVGAFAYLMKPFREQDLVPAIRTAQARHAELTDLRLQASTLREALAARKAIERAKGILMAKDGLTEAEAFDRLRRASQRSGRPMLVIAEAVTATLAES